MTDQSDAARIAEIMEREAEEVDAPWVRADILWLLSRLAAVTAERDSWQKRHDDAVQSLSAKLGDLWSEIMAAAYRAWPEAEDCAYDAGSIIDQLAAERDAAFETAAKVADAERAKCAEHLKPLEDDCVRQGWGMSMATAGIIAQAIRALSPKTGEG